MVSRTRLAASKISFPRFDVRSVYPSGLRVQVGAAKAELANYKLYDYIIVNDELERAAEELTAVLRSFRFSTATLKNELFQ